jgi:hypothetical protein
MQTLLILSVVLGSLACVFASLMSRNVPFGVIFIGKTRDVGLHSIFRSSFLTSTSKPNINCLGLLVLKYECISLITSILALPDGFP